MPERPHIGRARLVGMRVGRFLLRPMFAWRGRIVGRKFGGRSRCYDATARAACEAVIDAFELWGARPTLEYLDAMGAELEGISERLAAIVREHGISTDGTSKEGGR